MDPKTVRPSFPLLLCFSFVQRKGGSHTKSPGPAGPPRHPVLGASGRAQMQPTRVHDCAAASTPPSPPPVGCQEQVSVHM